MRSIWQYISNLGFGGLTLVVTGTVAFVIGILEFTPLVSLPDGIMLQIIVAAIGLVMATIASQGSQSSQQVKELRNDIRKLLTSSAEIELLEAQHQFPQKLVKSIMQVHDFVCDSNLTEVTPRQLGDPQTEYRRILDERLRNGRLTFQRVDVIYGEHNLRKVIHRLLQHQRELFCALLCR